jgi:predicted dehydrogenase/threonine dehydrogenase-like Zn-dependent dehydrogenase
MVPVSFDCIDRSMHQILQSYRTGELWLADVPTPAPRAGGVVVRTAASLVSAGTERMIIELARKSLLGKARARPDLVRKVVQKIKTEGVRTTLEKVFAKLDAPFALGYSCAGTVTTAGANTSGLRPCDRVACAGAGYATHADYNFVPKNLVVKIPDAVSFDDAAFTTLGSIAMQGVRQADVRLGERVVVIGLGLLGLLTVQILKAAGCQVLGSDLDSKKCQLAKELGADDAVAAGLLDAAASFTQGQGADAVIITAATDSNGPLESAAEISRMKGRVVAVGKVGMNVPRDPFYKKELDLRLSMSYGPGRYDPTYEEGGHDYPFAYVRWTEQRNMQSFLDLVAAGRVTPSKLVTHRFDIAEALKAYELLESGAQPYLGILIDYPRREVESPTANRIELRPSTPASQIGVGFIGAGNFAKGVLIPALKRSNGVELVGLCTATGMSGAITAQKQDFAYATTDVDRLLADDRINSVFIATRHDTHARFACAALSAGKHVFVEKPLCVTEDQLALYEQALSGLTMGRILMVGFNRRFSPHARALADAFAGRKTPTVINYRVNAGAVPKDVWVQDEDAGGGRIVGEVCHFVDFCEFLVGSEAVSVYADCIVSTDQRITPEDSTVITLRYADGSVATIQYIALGSPDLPKERVEVFADGKVAVMDDFVETRFYGGSAKRLRTKQNKGFDAEIEAFLGAIRRGGTAPISFESLARTTRTTFAILGSLMSGEERTAAPQSHLDPSSVEKRLADNGSDNCEQN